MRHGHVFNLEKGEQGWCGAVRGRRNLAGFHQSFDEGGGEKKEIRRERKEKKVNEKWFSLI